MLFCTQLLGFIQKPLTIGLRLLHPDFIQLIFLHTTKDVDFLEGQCKVFFLKVNTKNAMQCLVFNAYFCLFFRVVNIEMTFVVYYTNI